ncbi:cytochrome c maturation protein CcmE [Marinicauda salina]|uniref:Cytochrome c-type biogenesis protein CcmE n=1 Tax=Marinicauda salina TaxID=2135793 RepID=A0A2U2BSQ5_9PROT|nr:cytochrome c maturation protein CcmE [Marinicauda salina]PWE17032.1 cytochrome c maturation protein CcmE [Marinicauda salina]
MRKARRRLWIIAAAGVVLVAAGALAATALRDAVVFFYAPAEVAENPPEPGRRVRVGGLVVDGSVERPPEGGADFTVTDGAGEIRISYDGSLPDLFREGQGIVAEGAFETGGVFIADRVLAKHDETYMPPEVADALRESGMWHENGPGPSPESAYGYRPETSADEGGTE